MEIKNLIHKPVRGVFATPERVAVSFFTGIVRLYKVILIDNWKRKELPKRILCSHVTVNENWCLAIFDDQEYLYIYEEGVIPEEAKSIHGD